MVEIVNKYKWTVIVISVILLFFGVKSCMGKQILIKSVENKIMEVQVKKLQDGVKVIEQDRLRLKDSIKSEDIKKQKQINEFQQKAKESEKKVLALQESNKKQKEVIRNKNLIEVAEALNENYSSNNAVANSNSVDVKPPMTYQILETIADANTAQEIIKEKDKQLTSKDSVVNLKNEQLRDKDISLKASEKSLDAYKELNVLQTNLNNGLERENYKLKTKSWLEKALIPVSIGVGWFIGSKISK
jgi:hypothetical protein